MEKKCNIQFGKVFEEGLFLRDYLQAYNQGTEEPQGDAGTRSSSRSGVTTTREMAVTPTWRGGKTMGEVTLREAVTSTGHSQPAVPLQGGFQGICTLMSLSSLRPISCQHFPLTEPNYKTEVKGFHRFSPYRSASQSREPSWQGWDRIWRNRRRPHRQRQTTHSPILRLD